VQYYAFYFKDGKVRHMVYTGLQVSQLLQNLEATEYNTKNLKIYPEIRIYDKVFCLKEKSIGVVEALGIDTVFVALDSGRHCVVAANSIVNLSSQVDQDMMMFVSCAHCDKKVVEAFHTFEQLKTTLPGFEYMSTLDSIVLSCVDSLLKRGSGCFAINSEKILQDITEMLSNQIFSDLNLTLWYGYSVQKGAPVSDLDTFQVHTWDGKLYRFIPLDIAGYSDGILNLENATTVAPFID